MITILENKKKLTEYLRPLYEVWERQEVLFVTETLDQFRSSGKVDQFDLICVNCEELTLSELEPFLKKGGFYLFFGAIPPAHFADFKRKYTNAVLGFFSTQVPAFCQPFLDRLHLLAFSEVDQDFLFKMNQELASLIREGQNQLFHVKMLHEKMLPLTTRQVGALTFVSKFNAGIQPGGEFFDFKVNQHGLTVILSSAPDYILSGLVMGVFAEHDPQEQNGLEKTLQLIRTQIEERGSGTGAVSKHLSLLLARIDLGANSLEGYHFGHHALFTPEGKNVLPIGGDVMNTRTHRHFSLPLEKRLILFSAGCEKNLAGKNLKKLVVQHGDLPGRDFIQELFFEMRKDRQDRFLEVDASIIYFQKDRP